MNEPKYGTPEWDVYVQKERERLEVEYGQVWSTDEVTSEFEVESFLAPFCFVKSKETGQGGSLMFQGSPRFYFMFRPDGG